MTEIWKPVNFIPFVEASNLGNVRSLDRGIETSDGRKQKVKGCIRKKNISSHGYLYVSFIDHRKKTINFHVHRLVMEAFIGPKPVGMDICHNNGIKTDNRIENLRFATRRENNLDKREHGTMPRGSKHHYSKLTEPSVFEIRQKSLIGVDYKALAKEFGVSKGTIGDVVRRRTWRHI